LIIFGNRRQVMAQKIQTLVIDDIDGSEAEGTVRFGLDGANYEIDLNSTHSAALRGSLGPFIEHARKVGGRRGARGAGRTAAASGIDTTAVRAWARERGIEIKERGRVPAAIVEQYREATGK
jgi:hypothetical protein